MQNPNAGPVERFECAEIKRHGGEHGPRCTGCGKVRDRAIHDPSGHWAYCFECCYEKGMQPNAVALLNRTADMAQHGVAHCAMCHKLSAVVVGELCVDCDHMLSDVR